MRAVVLFVVEIAVVGFGIVPVISGVVGGIAASVAVVVVDIRVARWRLLKVRG